MVDTTWTNRKAVMARSSWLQRAKKVGVPKEEVPTRAQIQKWLELNNPPVCYLSNKTISVASVEIDHKTPLCKGGSFSLDNAGLTTRFYNNAKGSLTEEEFRGLLDCVSKWSDKGESLLLRLISSNLIYSKRKSYKKRK